MVVSLDKPGKVYLEEKERDEHSLTAEKQGEICVLSGAMDL